MQPIHLRVRSVAASALIGMAACGRLLHVSVPAPRGPFPVGRSAMVLVDSSRHDPWSGVATEPRFVPLKAWYPAQPGASRRADYLPDAGRLPGDFSPGERSVAQSLGSHATADPPIAGSADGWPVILFSPGADTPPDYYAGLLEQLASTGYVVLAVDHAHEGRGQVLPDGRILGAEAEHLPPARPNGEFFRRYVQRVAVRVSDASFALNALEQGNPAVATLSRSLDLHRVGALGHSLGGVAAMELCRRDRRVIACVNLDGLARGMPMLDDPADSMRRQSMYVGKPLQTLDPAMLDSARHVLRSMIARGGGGYNVTVSGASHNSFSDAPFFKPGLRPESSRRLLDELRSVLGGYFDMMLRPNGKAGADAWTRVTFQRLSIERINPEER